MKLHHKERFLSNDLKCPGEKRWGQKVCFSILLSTFVLCLTGMPNSHKQHGIIIQLRLGLLTLNQTVGLDRPKTADPWMLKKSTSVRGEIYNLHSTIALSYNSAGDREVGRDGVCVWVWLFV